MKMYLGLIGLGAPAVALGVGSLLGAASAQADTGNTFPCGTACANSTVSYTSADNGRSVTKQYTTKDGTIVNRVTGKGPDLTIFNPNDPSITVPLKGNGSNSVTKTSPDGTSTLTVTGHNVLVYYPTDTLAGGAPGPATELITGRTVINVDAQGNWTTVSQNGKVTDICAQLPPG